MDRFDPFVKYADVYGDIINWEKDPMNKPQNQNKYFFSDGKTYYEQICKMLRLMSVFKEAFNQIYSNEDEISEAWENFVNNLSASVVEGSEPDVTLTWTDDSVNFEFTMVPGVPGEQGVGITSISFNSDYTMTITLSDGNSYTSMSLKGETGPQGPQGETGSGLQILDVYATLADLQSAHPTGQPGDAYQVGSAGNYTLYIWSSSQSAWVQAGTLGTVSPYTSAPLMNGTASAGSQNLYARGDHVHPSDTSRASKEELDALIKTSQSLIDQSFTYRESPAIQDGLARIDKIKGNTLGWNQLCEVVNPTSTSSGVTMTNNGDGSLTLNGTATGQVDFRFDQPVSMNNLKNYPSAKYLFVCNNLPDGVQFIIMSYPDYVRMATFTSSPTLSLVTVTGRDNCFMMLRLPSGIVLNNVKLVPQLFNLTKIFGKGKEPTRYEDFVSLFPLKQYDYNSGGLLSFNGTGLKTTGVNLLNFSRSSVTTSGLTFTNDNGIVTINGTATSNAFFRMNVAIPQNSYNISAFNDAIHNNVHLAGQSQDGSYPFDMTMNSVSRSIQVNADINNFIIWVNSGATLNNFVVKPMVSFESVTSYESYQEHITSIPIFTYFPSGMKSAGNAYDELTDSKAIARIGQLDLGDLVWRYVPANTRFEANMPSNYKTPTSVDNMHNMICDRYPTNSNPLTGNAGNGITGYQNSNLVYVKDDSFTDVSAFTNAVTGSILYYEQSAPVETAVDLDLAFNAYEDGTEQLLPVNGSVPSTSPIIADMTYLSIDDAMEYVLEKLANVPQNTQQILESLEDDVADLQTDVGALQPAVSGLQTSVGNINTNIGQLSSTVAGHTASISGMQSDITDLNTGLSDLEDTVTDNTSRIGTLETGLTTTNGNVQSLSSQVQSIDGRVTNLESDLFKVVVKEFDYDSVASESNFGTTTPITQEEGYRVIGVVGTEAQAGEYTSPASNIAITQCHIYYTSLGALTITIFGRNTGLSARTNVRIYAYLLCIKDIQ